MDECTIKSLMVLDITVVEGRKAIVIPYEDLLRGKISIRINQPAQPTTEQPVKQKTVETPPFEIMIPAKIASLYPNDGISKLKLTQDVADYLRIIAKCWEYKGLSFKPSILKKAAISKPALNGAVFQVYGKEGDKYLTELVTSNMPFIHTCWEEIKAAEA